MYSKYFYFWKMSWDNKYITDIEKYKQAVVKGLITADEFKEITGLEYTQ